jgi:chlorobactene glucosyltransferase
LDPLLLSLPWIGIGLFMTLYFRNPKALPLSGTQGDEGAPFVSIIVPARNEESNIRNCVDSLASSEYPAYEILVVDDRSQDRTAEIVEALRSEVDTEIRLIRGRPLPDGWFGKPWACWQGAGEAKGDLLLFTDADTVHDPILLREAVKGLQAEGADVCTLLGRQVMGSFWEQLIQPQFFMLLAFRFPRSDRPKRPHQWKHAIANGQYLLFRREAYEALGGHESVAGEVVEDLRLAQLLVREGWTLTIRGTDGLQTRMYRSLPELVEGWSKNVSTAALQSTARWLLPVILPMSLIVGVLLWLLPPTALVWALLSGKGGLLLSWAVVATGLSVLIWGRASVLMRGNALYGLLYPMGALVGTYIFLKSWWQGPKIEWKGRRYRMRHAVRIRPPEGSTRERAGEGGAVPNRSRPIREGGDGTLRGGSQR